jgi:hypothetical protein
MSEQESNPVDTGGGNYMSTGPFTDFSDANKDLLNDIQKVTASTPPSLPDHMIKSAKQAGEMASNAKTVEDKQNIYKSYLSKSNVGKEATTSQMVKDWENAADFFRNKKK